MSLTNRSARSHRSTKLPNVKLRPAPSKSSASNKRERERLAEEEDQLHFRNQILSVNDEEETDAFTFEKQAIQNRKPLTGLSLCFTQVGQLKPQLQQYAATLGATWTPSLMEFTTHLVATTPGSEKYNVALKHAINLMHPDWLSEIRQCWIDDVSFDLEELTEKHRLKPLSGFNICITGFKNGTDFSQMVRFIKFLGGNYLSEFDLNGEVTHLICSDTLLSGTTIDYSKSSSLRTLNAWKEKFHKKLRETGERDERVEVMNSFTVKCLWQSWIEDCDELQAYIPETLYTIENSLPTSERRDQAKAPIKHCLAARDRILAEREEIKTKEVAQEETKVHIFDDDETRVKLKPGISRRADLKGKAKELVQDSAPGASGGKSMRSGILDSIIASSTSTNAESQQGEEKKIMNLSRASSFAPNSHSSTSSSSRIHSKDSTDNGKGKARLLDRQSRTLVESSATPDERAFTSASTSTSNSSLKDKATTPLKVGVRKEDLTQVQEEDDDDDDDDDDDEEYEEEDEIKNLFKGLVMAVDPSLEAKSEPLRDYLKEQGARVISSDEVKSKRNDLKLDYYVLPIRPPFNVSDLNLDPTVNLVTHQWINRCTFFRKLVSSDPSRKNCGLKPSLMNFDKFPIPESRDISVSFTSMPTDGLESSEARNVLESLGLNYTDSVKRGVTTHLVKGSSSHVNSTKENIARTWGIELVDLNFLNNALETGRFDPPVNPKSKETRVKSSSTSSIGSNLTRVNSKSNQSQNELSDSLNENGTSLSSDVGRFQDRESMSRNDSMKSIDEEDEEGMEERKASSRANEVSKPDRKKRRTSEDRVEDRDVKKGELSSTTASNRKAAKPSTPARPPSPLIPASDGATQAAADTVDEVMAMLNERANSPTNKGKRKVRAPPNRLRNGGNRSSNTNTPKGEDSSDPKSGGVKTFTTSASTATTTNENTTEDIEALLAAHRKAEALKICNDSFDENHQNGISVGKEKEESLRIIYDNPQAAKEKKRLLNLLAKAEQEAASKKRKLNQEKDRDYDPNAETMNSSHTWNSSDKSSMTASDSKPSSPSSIGGSKRVTARKQPGSRR